MKAVSRKLMLVAWTAALALAVACGSTSSPDTVSESPTRVVTAIPTASPVPTTQPQESGTSETGAESSDEGPLDALVARLAEETWDFLVDLTTNYSPRETATEEEKVAADFLVEAFEKIGYEAELQPFSFDLLDRDGPLLTLTKPEQRDIESLPMTLAGMGRSTGLLVDVGLAGSEDIPAQGLDGKIAFVARGIIPFEEKVHRVEAAGVVAAVVYNNVPGLFSGTLSSQAGIPAVSISKASGESVAELMANGDVEVTVSLVSKVHDSRNVVAEKPGTASDGGVVVLGGPYDTVPNVSGANDNGSGIATLLTIARAVTDSSFPFTLRFIAFGSEEVGLVGSRFYITTLSEDEAGDIIAMLNFDIPGSGRVVQVFGSPDLSIRALSYSDANGLGVRRGSLIEGTGSDHESFSNADIPALFFFADDASRIHSPADTLEFVDPELMGTTVVLALGLLESLAQEP